MGISKYENISVTLKQYYDKGKDDSQIFVSHQAK